MPPEFPGENYQCTLDAIRQRGRLLAITGRNTIGSIGISAEDALVMILQGLSLNTNLRHHNDPPFNMIVCRAWKPSSNHHGARVISYPEYSDLPRKPSQLHIVVLIGAAHDWAAIAGAERNTPMSHFDVNLICNISRPSGRFRWAGRWHLWQQPEIRFVT